jgi:hypothetical protein
MFSLNETKPIKSIKTPAHKSAFNEQKKTFDIFKNRYDEAF